MLGEGCCVHAGPGRRCTVFTSEQIKCTCLWEESPELSSELQATYGLPKIEQPTRFCKHFYKRFIVVTSNLSSILIQMNEAASSVEVRTRSVLRVNVIMEDTAGASHTIGI